MIDIHVHFFPSALFQAIWNFFENQSHGLWNIRYKLFGPDHVEALKTAGVRRFTTLVYAHKPGLAAYLNDFVRESADEFPEMIPFGTVFVGDHDYQKTARKIFEEYQFYGIKLHPFVSKEELDDPRFFSVYEMMQAQGKVLLCHPGSGPVYHNTGGVRRLHAVLTEFPSLKVVIAHCGAFEYDEYFALADEFEHVYFDTAMNCVHQDIFRNNCPGREVFVRYQERILFGSDFPNIPYDYQDQITGLRQLNLGQDIEEKIFTSNAQKLLGM